MEKLNRRMNEDFKIQNKINEIIDWINNQEERLNVDYELTYSGDEL